MANQGKRMVPEDQIKKLENLADIREAGENITIENGVISAFGGGGTEYTAGENITIENGVISATDTTYTAGTGITISESNVISASGEGSVKLYRHNIILGKTGSQNWVALEILSNNISSISLDSFKTYLTSNGYTDIATANKKYYICNGKVSSGGNYYEVYGIVYDTTAQDFIFVTTGTNGTTSLAGSLIGNLTDTVTEIL